MKNLYCLKCDSIVRLVRHDRRCECGHCGGRYTDDINAIFFGKKCIPFGIDNHSFAIRITRDIEKNFTLSFQRGEEMDSGSFSAFVFGEIGECPKTIKRLTKKEYEGGEE